MNRNKAKFALAALALALSLPAQPCSRAVYIGDENVVITGRTVDWYVPIDTQVWISPRGVTRNGHGQKNSLQWTARYGSVFLTGFTHDVVDGMNEKGLVVNKLYLLGANMGNPGDKSQLSLNVWAQYVLDNYASVKEAVEGLEKEPFRIAPSDTGSPVDMHLSLSDGTGDSAILEYLNGKLNIHHGKKYAVMTNEPSFDEQLAILRHWEQKGDNSLPGSSDSADRFVRLNYLLKQLPPKLKPEIAPLIPDGKLETQALYGIMSVMRGISEPFPFATEAPNNASTLYRTYHDHKNLKIYFEGANSLKIQVFDLKTIDFSAGRPTLMLEMDKQKDLPENPMPLFKPATDPYQETAS